MDITVWTFHPSDSTPADKPYVEVDGIHIPAEAVSVIVSPTEPEVPFDMKAVYKRETSIVLSITVPSARVNVRPNSEPVRYA